MARGRGGSLDPGSLIITSRRREASPEYNAFGASSKAYRISYDADNDAGELSKKSRDRDRQLLTSITQRLVDNDSVMYKPPPSPRYLPPSYIGPGDLPLSPLFVRATSLPPRRSKVKTFDIEYEPDTKPKSSIDIFNDEYVPYKPRVYTRTHRPKVEVYSQIFKPMYEHTVPHKPTFEYSPITKPTYDYYPIAPLPPKPVYNYSSPPTSRYEYTYVPTHVVPMPTHRVEYFEDDYVSLPRRPARIFTHSTPVRVGTQRELGLEPSFDEPTVIHRHSGPVIRAAPTTIRHRVAAPVHAPSSVRVRSSSVPASPRIVPRNRSRMADIETRIEADAYTKSAPTFPLSELRARTSEAKNKLDTHKAMMDRYLPIYLGPENDVEYEVDYKYGELVDRMPQLEPYRPGMGSVGKTHSPSVAPYVPANRVRSNPVKFSPAPRGNFRPHVSDTRRRIRDVICSTRKDPHYFD